MRHCLVIMHARNVAPAQRAFAELEIPKLWLTGYTEKELANGVHDYAISESDFDTYIMVSDDAIVRQSALDAVIDALEEGCEVATGYSQRSHTDWTVNVTAGPLKDKRPTVDAYEFRQFKEVVSWPEHLVPTWFVGMSLTGMSRSMWMRYPFGCFTDTVEDNGYASDFHLSKRLQDSRVPIYAVRDAFCYHWRTDWQCVGPNDDQLFIGEVEPSVVLQAGEAVSV